MVLCPNFLERKFASLQKFLTPKKREIEKIEHNFNFEARRSFIGKKKEKGWMKKGMDELM